MVLIDKFMLQSKLNHTINHSWSHEQYIQYRMSLCQNAVGLLMEGALVTIIISEQNIIEVK